MANPLVWPRAYVVQDQGDAWACWAAVLEAVTAYYLGANYNAVGFKPSIASISEEYKAAGGPAKHAGSAGDMEKALKLTGHFAGYQRANLDNGRRQFQPSNNNFALIRQQIDANHPLICVMKYHAHPPQHVVMIYGYTAGASPVVRVADPSPGQSRKDDWDFTEFCTNYRGMAHWEGVGLTRENEFANLRDLFA